MILREADDQRTLERAFALLEEPSFAAKATGVLGEPVAQAMTLLPPGWAEKVTMATETALSRALDAAVLTLRQDTPSSASHFTHKLFSGLSGAAGGAFGLPALALELPLSLVIMLRSIADIARSEGEKVRDPLTKLACLEVLALGGVGETRDPRRHGYYAVRVALASAVSEAARFVAQKGVISHGAPPLIRLITQIAGRLSVQVTEKAAAQAVPILGAAGGAAINLMFLDHFQDMARGHFAIRRLERTYGPEAVHAAYEALRAPQHPPPPPLPPPPQPPPPPPPH
jgi:hypothetical protein